MPIPVEQDGWPVNGGPILAENDRPWDVTNYLDSPKDAYLFLEAAAEDDAGDGIQIRNAWSHIERAHEEGKVSIYLAMTGEQFSEELRKHGIYERTIPRILQALGHTVPVAD